MTEVIESSNVRAAPPTPRQTCEYKRYSTPRGCHKRATTAVLYRYFWGHRVQPPQDIYARAVTYRCDDHVADVQDAEGTMSIEEVRQAFAASEKAPCAG